MPSPIHRTTFLWAALTFTYICILAASVFVLAPAYGDWFFSEEGPHEIASVVLWAGATLVTLRYVPQTRRALLYSTLFALFAMREADLHKAFTSGSIVKLKFYTQGMGPEQWASLPFALAIVGLLLACAVGMVRYLLRGGWREASGQLMFIAASAMVFCKIADRLPSRHPYQPDRTARPACLRGRDRSLRAAVVHRQYAAAAQPAGT